MRRFIINGNSMEPTLLDGQSCLIVEGAFEFHQDDIICFRRFDRKVIHRLIVKKTVFGKTIYIERGDNYPIASLVEADDMIGKCINSKKVLCDRKDNKCRVLSIILFDILLKKSAVFLKKIRLNGFSDVLCFLRVFVIPTLVMKNDTLKVCIRELKLTYSVYRKYNRFQTLKKWYVDR